MDVAAATRLSASGCRPSLAPWLLRYLRACAPGRADAAERLQRELCRESLELFAGLAEAGIDSGFRRRGCLTVHMGEAAEEHAAAEAASETGRSARRAVLDGAEARRELEPLLSDRVRAAVLFPHEGECDPVRLVRSAGAVAAERGVRLRDGVEAYAMRADGGAVRIETTHGAVHAGRAVLAAGAWSGRLARTLGVRLPLQGGRATPRSGIARRRRCACRSTCTTSGASPTRWTTARG